MESATFTFTLQHDELVDAVKRLHRAGLTRWIEPALRYLGDNAPEASRTKPKIVAALGMLAEITKPDPLEQGIRKAMSLLRAEETATAIALLEEVRKAAQAHWSVNESVGWYQIRSLAEAFVGNHGQASVFMEEAAGIDPDRVSLWTAAAVHAEQAGQYERCARLLRCARRARTWATDADSREFCEKLESQLEARLANDPSLLYPTDIEDG